MTDVTSWQIDPETLGLVGPAGPPEGYTPRQFAAQMWPPCPVCGAMIQVNGIEVESPDDPEPRILPGPWRCPQGCDRRRQQS